jgi:type I restriction enzyme S subunit
MKPYPKYRDSGVEWIGRIPDHWKMTKLKRLARVKLSNSRRVIKSAFGGALECSAS